MPSPLEVQSELAFCGVKPSAPGFVFANSTDEENSRRDELARIIAEDSNWSEAFAPHYLVGRATVPKSLDFM